MWQLTQRAGIDFMWSGGVPDFSEIQQDDGDKLPEVFVGDAGNSFRYISSIYQEDIRVGNEKNFHHLRSRVLFYKTAYGDHKWLVQDVQVDP